MRKTYILGYSEAVLSMMLETIRVNGLDTPVSILKNQRIEKLLPFIPPGMDIKVEDWYDGFDLSNPDFEFLLGVATPKVKKAVASFFLEYAGITPDRYIPLVHATSTVASSAQLAAAVYVEPGCVISPFADIQFGVTINRGVTVGHHTILEAFVSLNPGVHIAGNVQIRTGAQIGIGTTVFNAIEIGANTIVGGGSVVTKSLPDNVLAWGNPCKVIRAVHD